MKRSLMADYGVPENAILIDPHARHTTTNMRNTAWPFDQEFLPKIESLQLDSIDSLDP
jgi:uncharacterized SAM-binding protein YcdF (DUF218 family)